MMATDRATAFPFLRSVYPWLIVACGMLFYCFNYFLRSGPSVMQNELSQYYHITAYEFGLIASAYYWAYTPMQIPAGMLYDKFGVRFVLFIACLFGVFGLTLFISAETFNYALIGRFLIGIGCAFAYIGTLKLASIWLPVNLFGTVAGLTTAVGMMSGALTQQYISRAVTTYSYQDVLQPAVLIGIALSLIIIFFVKDKSNGQNVAANEMQNAPDLKELFKALWIILRNKQMWLIGAIGCLLYLPASLFLDAYCKQYLITVFQITPAQAVNVASFTFAGWIISCPLIGIFSDKIKRRCWPLTFTGFFAAALLCLVFYVPQFLNVYGLYTIFFMIGFSCGAHPLCFPLGKENNPIQISGTSVAYTNMIIMLGGSIFPPIVGRLLNWHSTKIGIDGLPIYDASDYTFALSIVPIGVAIGIFLSLFLKETYCEQVTSHDEPKDARDTIDLEPEVEPAKS